MGAEGRRQVLTISLLLNIFLLAIASKNNSPNFPPPLQSQSFKIRADGVAQESHKAAADQAKVRNIVFYLSDAAKGAKCTYLGVPISF